MILVFLLAAAWPLRDALVEGRMAGSGPDVTVTLWGMWWFSEEAMGPAWTGASTLVNYPIGAVGAVLAPVTSGLWAVLSWFCTAGTAGTWTGLIYLAGWCATVAWLARLTGVGRMAAAFAGVLALHGRYLVYALGETSIVGITALPALLSVGALLSWRLNPARRWLVLYVVASAAVGLEFPYLAPVPPLLGLLAYAERRDRRVLAAVVVATALLLGAVMITGRGQIPFGSARIGSTVTLFGLHFPSAEDLVARARLGDQLWPRAVRWSVSGASGTLRAGGREYVGLSLLLAALAGAWVRPRQALPWLLAGLVGMILATGSSWGGHASPFALINSVAAKAVRALTQPTRYLVLTSAALPIAAAHLLDHLAVRRWVALAFGGVLLIDAIGVGGLSLTLPVSRLPEAPCVAALADLPRTAVLTLPWDALSDGDAALRSREWQTLHSQAAAVFGVGSWTLGEGGLATSLLDDLKVGPAVVGLAPLNVHGLRELGFTYLVADLKVGEWLEGNLRDDIGAPQTVCEGAAVWNLALTRPDGKAAGAVAATPKTWKERALIRAADRKDFRGAPLKAH